MREVVCPRALQTCTNDTNDHASVLIPPRLTSGLLFCECFQTIFSQMFKLVDFQLDQYVL